MRSAVLISALGFLIVVVNSGAWVHEQLMLREERTTLEDSLISYIEYQIADKAIPGLSISVISDQVTRFEEGFGYANLDKRTLSTPYTVYKGGALAQIFTTVGILQRAEIGYLDLDLPVSTYIPGFQPDNPYGLPLTLRQLLSHQSGLATEPPLGHSFDTSAVTLAESIESLNTTSVIYPPETFTKFSNAGFGVAGLVLEASTGKPYEQHMRAILDRMTMMRTSFSPRLDLVGKLAQGYGLQFDGQVIPYISHEVGNTPAANVFTTVNDLGAFLRVIFADGISLNGQILSSNSFEQMWTVQLSTARRQLPYGLGFELSELNGHQRATIATTFQGYTACFDFLPELKAGVTILANAEHAEGALFQICEYALQLLIAEQQAAPLPEAPRTSAPDSTMIARAVGYYEDNEPLYVSALDNELYLYQKGGKYRLRQLGDTLVVDDVHEHGTQLLADGLSLELDNTLYVKRDPLSSITISDQFDDVLGAYGTPHHPFVLTEHLGTLYVLEGWRKPYRLNPTAVDTFALPADGKYGGEPLIITKRDAQNQATQIQLGNMLFDRLSESSYMFSYTELSIPKPGPNATPDDLPVAEETYLRTPELIDLTMIDPLLNLDVRYATDDNAFGRRLYNEARIFLQRPIAEALMRIQRRVRRMGYDLVLYDAYRPWYVSQGIWSTLPDTLQYYFEDPTKGTCQNRGAAVSLSFYQLNTGTPIDMPTEYGVLSPMAHADYPLLPAISRRNRNLLRHIMEAEGFKASPFAWWHYTHQSCTSYPIMNEPFEKVTQQGDADQVGIYTVR